MFFEGDTGSNQSFLVSWSRAGFGQIRDVELQRSRCGSSTRSIASGVIENREPPVTNTRLRGRIEGPYLDALMRLPAACGHRWRQRFCRQSKRGGIAGDQPGATAIGEPSPYPVE